MSLFNKKHDFERQRKETYETFSTIQDKVTLPEKANIDFHFIAREIFPRFEECAMRLKLLGFEVSAYGRTLQATMKNSEVNVENIWSLEMAASQIALNFKFKPDGWGMGGPKSPN